MIVDLWDSDKPATGMNGTGPDHYEEALFEERLINNHDPSTPLFLYYPAHFFTCPFKCQTVTLRSLTSSTIRYATSIVE